MKIVKVYKAEKLSHTKSCENSFFARKFRSIEAGKVITLFKYVNVDEVIVLVV